MIRAHHAASRGASAAAALADLRELRADLIRLQETVAPPGGATSAAGPGRSSAQTSRPGEKAARSYFRRDAAALRVLDGVSDLRRRAMEATRAALRQGGVPPDPASPPAAGGSNPDLVQTRRDLAAAPGRIESLEELCIADLCSAAEEAGRGRIPLAASLGVIVGLLALSLYAERARRHHRRGARLVEDMLEAYSRRLEAMNVQLEQVNLLKTQFLANTSHELLTPLNGVMGSLEVVRSGSCRSVEDERTFLDQAYQSAERLFALIRDLLDLCRLEEGNLALRCRPLDFGGILERELASHRSELGAHGLVLLVTPPVEGWPRVAADSERVTQVLHHLIANALKFTEHGSLRVTGRVEDGTPRFLRVEVADTGVGIEPGKLGQVFDLFSQVDGSSTRKFGGAGLGLTLSRHLVQGMGGRIGIDSDGPGRGTRAWFTLPLAGDVGESSVPPPDDRSRAA